MPNPVLPNPLNYVCHKQDLSFVPIMTTLPLAPDAILMLVKCDYSKTKSTTDRCKIKTNKLICTEFMCMCGSEEMVVKIQKVVKLRVFLQRMNNRRQPCTLVVKSIQSLLIP